MHQAALRLVKSFSSPEIAPTVREYLLTKRQAARSANTIRQYALRLGEFVSWLARRHVTRLGDLSKLLLREWGVSLPPNWAPATTRNTVAIVNAFLNWCFSEGLIADELGRVLHVPPPKRRLQRTLSSVEVIRQGRPSRAGLFW